jgi:hypothetical protein
MVAENTSRSPMIAVRLLDGTQIYARAFRLTDSALFVGELKYSDGDELPAYIEDTMLLNIDAVASYAILHIGGEDEDG